jgi:hypothetical protein
MTKLKTYGLEEISDKYCKRETEKRETFENKLRRQKMNTQCY